MTHTSDPSALPEILRSSEIYDRIMGEIEPELCIAELTTIAQKTKMESLEERTARAKRYADAFAEYDKRFALYCTQWKHDFDRYRSFSFHSLEDLLQNAGTTHLDTIVDSIHTA